MKMSDQFIGFVSVAISLQNLSPRDAMHVLCLCLAQSGEAHRDIGYQTQNEAFEEIAARFGSKPNTVKNDRDAFDRYTDSARAGWQKELRPALRKILDAAEGISRSELMDLGRAILSRSWDVPLASSKDVPTEDESSLDDIFGLSNTEDNLIKVREPYIGAAITFSNSHKRNTDAWFVLTAEQLKQSLIDILAHRDSFLENYDEAKHRELFDRYLTDDVARYMASVQTMPFFEVLSKVIHYSGKKGGRLAKSIDLSASAIQRAIQALEQLAVRGVAAGTANDSRAKGTNAHGGQNKIYYGAPGTGKSYRVDALVGQENVIRTVFHPDTQNSDFFGSLKPVMADGKVAYRFAPGPLCRAICAALKDPAHHHYLVIEELNRAPAAAVFGELFQLLDRKESGLGEYSVDFPNPESADWFKTEEVIVEKLVMPSNLSIVATMNSADQGVYPIDTAFRRRWEQEYLPLYEGEGPQGEIFVIGLDNVEIRIGWKVFVKALNNWLIKLDLAEDRLLGLWFAKESELGQHVPAKILLYLWDDLLRHEGRPHMFAQHIRTYGELNEAVKAKKQIFSNGFIEALNSLRSTLAAVDNSGAPEGVDAAGE